MKEKKDIGLRIRQIRGRRTQEAFGQMLEATQSYISDLERGKCFPSISFLIRLQELSGRSFDWILTGQEPRPSPLPRPEDMEDQKLGRIVSYLREAPAEAKLETLRGLLALIIYSL
jgi:transcriptional regulator with XRE-family HTH domain